ncbi:ROK family transcriptional regulator [Massiliimalia massiliensis]|uniref:ROK family transcriptional regulator n=1 Tax=Massiliimalia massiliensis TaxID=1852384 RepID=UPI0009859795|nr:ROK family transcriptional regulator [Massiliimalia massiliensis]
MEPNTNGINMLDVKKNNRSSIINLIHQSNGISRKEIADELGLTPAAITLITNDLVQENLIFETVPKESVKRKGRKQVLLNINRSAYVSIGVYISLHHFSIIAIDLTNRVIFQDQQFTDDCYQQSTIILSRIAKTILDKIALYDLSRKQTILGVGVCVHGIVDTAAGISTDSYGTWEKNVDVVNILQQQLSLPVILTNNICALAHGEAFLSKTKTPNDMLFIKYGPGIGAAKVNSKKNISVFDYHATELGHLIMDPHGKPCICGKQGCLETISGYRNIEQEVSALYSKTNTPILYSLTQGKKENINMEIILQAYNHNERVAQVVIDRAMYYFSLAICNTIQLLRPKQLVLYGTLFENTSFRKIVVKNLSAHSIADKVSFSDFTPRQQALGPATVMTAYFFENGGIL